MSVALPAPVPSFEPIRTNKIGGLVLSRKRGERVIIGEGPKRVVVSVVEIRGDKVRLAFAAARDVVIHRDEVFERICIEAAGTSFSNPNDQGGQHASDQIEIGG